MKKPISFGSIGFELVSSMEEDRARPTQETPFRICIMGDFSGRASRGILEPLKGRRPLHIDRDNIDEILKKLKVTIRLEHEGASFDCKFASLDDFHPESLFERLEIFRSLNDTRAKLDDPRTFNTALSELRKLTGDDEPKTEPKKQPLKETVRPEGGILDQMIGETLQRPTREPGTTGQSDLDAFVNTIVKPYLVAREDPDKDQLKAALDEIVSLIMAEVLHNPAFQAVESAWRGICFLVSRVETDEMLSIYLLDISQEELAADLLADDNLMFTAIYKLFVEEVVSTLGGTPWAVLIGNYTFGYDNTAVLGRMGKIAALAGAPFLTHAEAQLIGCESLYKTPHHAVWKHVPDHEAELEWDALRHLPEATYIGLAIPRFLLRLPYGKDSDPVDVFDFEEMSDGLQHEHYLWGNPAFVCAYLLAEAFSHEGWSMTPGSVHDIEGLPLHVNRIDGESRLKPCAEVLLTDDAIEIILNKGIMPIATIMDTDAARLMRFQSLADPPTRLAGRWAGRE